MTEEWDEQEEEETEEEYYDESEEENEEEKEVLKEVIDYEQGKTTYLYSNGTYRTVDHQQESGGASGCFIATACYGSPLDRHVVFLRLFRDTEVLESALGKGFMRLFNRFYYSFSPSLASLIARHTTLRLVSRYLIVAPIIHMLRCSCFLMRPISRFSREASVLGTGVTFSLIFLAALWISLRLVAVLVR